MNILKFFFRSNVDKKSEPELKYQDKKYDLVKKKLECLPESEKKLHGLDLGDESRLEGLLGSVIDSKVISEKIAKGQTLGLQERSRVKLVLTDLESEEFSKNLFMMIMQNIPLKTKKKALNSIPCVRAALIIDHFYVEWTDRSFVIVKGCTSEPSFDDKALIAADITFPNKKTVKQSLKEISEIAAEWNLTKEYNEDKCNSQHFVLALLEKLGIDPNFISEESALGKFMDELKKKGKANATFHVSKNLLDTRSKSGKSVGDILIAKKFLQNNKPSGISISNHDLLDEFVHLLKEYATTYLESEQGKQDYQLLKAFDRAFWLRHLRDAKDETAEPNKQLGCPFGDPRSGSYPGAKPDQTGFTKTESSSETYRSSDTENVEFKDLKQFCKGKNQDEIRKCLLRIGKTVINSKDLQIGRHLCPSNILLTENTLKFNRNKVDERYYYPKEFDDLKEIEIDEVDLKLEGIIYSFILIVLEELCGKELPEDGKELSISTEDCEILEKLFDDLFDDLLEKDSKYFKKEYLKEIYKMIANYSDNQSNGEREGPDKLQDASPHNQTEVSEEPFVVADTDSSSSSEVNNDQTPVWEV